MIIFSLLLLAVSTCVILTIGYALKSEQLRRLQQEEKKLRHSLDEMDEQAKLIVRTDMELNRIQEELDKKVSGLYSLQRLGRAVSTTLEEAHVFQRIDQDCFKDLGFEKACCFLWREQEKAFTPSLVLGYPGAQQSQLRLYVSANHPLFLK
jgi:hypothetical protein